MFKSVEVKHFTKAEGVHLSPEFMKYFYSSFLAELQRFNVADQTVEDGVAITDTDTPKSMMPHFIVLEGTFSAVQEGSEKDGKFEAGSAHIGFELYRRSDHKEESRLNCTVSLDGPPQSAERKVAEAAGVEAAGALRKLLYP
jgi:hypothetical protein